MKSKKGGMVSIKPQYTAAGAFNYFLNNSHINYFSNGSFGIIFKVTLKHYIPSNDSPYRSFNPHLGYTDLRTIIFKLVFLSDTKITYEFDMTEFNSTKFELHSVKSDSFKNETNIQIDIHEKSYDYGEPICPSVIFSTILEGKRVLEFAENLLHRIRIHDGTGLTLETLLIFPQIHESAERNPILQMGIIAMEFAEDYSTMYDMLNKDVRTKENSIYMSLYVLIELYRLGYTHGDPNYNNILINITYHNYFYGLFGRPLIIDFGMTKLLTDRFRADELSYLQQLYSGRNYTELLKNLELTTEEKYMDFLHYDRIEDMNTTIHSYLMKHNEASQTLQQAALQNRIRYPEVPIYPLSSMDKSDPTRVNIYTDKLGGGGIKKTRHKTRHKNKNKKKRKGQTYNNRKKTVRNKK